MKGWFYDWLSLPNIPGFSGFLRLCKGWGRDVPIKTSDYAAYLISRNWFGS